MTKKVKSSKQKFEPSIYELPFMNIAYGLFTNRAELDKVLKAADIPTYKFDTDLIICAATIRGEYQANDGMVRRYAFVYSEYMLNDNSISEALKLSYLAHEAHHVVKFMFECMCEAEPSEETFAYTLGNVCNTLFSEYFRWKEAQRG